MFSTPCLALQKITKSFLFECDALGTGIGEILMQEGRTFAFISQQLSGKHLGHSTYEKEKVSKLHAVDTWKLYLLGVSFLNPY